MKTFNYKNQTYSCEIIYRNTNPIAKSKCVRIITENGIRNIYTIADGYSKAFAYEKNSIVLSDIVVGKALCILGLMNAGSKFVFKNDSTMDTNINISTVSSSVKAAVSNINSMYRVIDINTGSIAMFSSEIDVVSYCIGRTVKVDKIELSTGIEDTNIVADDDTSDTPIAPTENVESTPKRRKKTDYTTSNPKPTDSEDIIPDVPVIAPDTSSVINTDDIPKPRRMKKS